MAEVGSQNMAKWVKWQVKSLEEFILVIWILLQDYLVNKKRNQVIDLLLDFETLSIKIQLGIRQ